MWLALTVTLPPALWAALVLLGPYTPILLSLTGTQPEHAFVVFRATCMALNALRIATIAWALWPAMRMPSTLALGAGLAMVVTGQALNTYVYTTIGSRGVYYGTAFGLRVPWSTGLPFRVLRDPQYLGAMLTYTGAALATNILHLHHVRALLVLLGASYYLVGRLEAAMAQRAS